MRADQRLDELSGLEHHFCMATDGEAVVRLKEAGAGRVRVLDLRPAGMLAFYLFTVRGLMFPFSVMHFIKMLMRRQQFSHQRWKSGVLRLLCHESGAVKAQNAVYGTESVLTRTGRLTVSISSKISLVLKSLQASYVAFLKHMKAALMYTICLKV